MREVLSQFGIDWSVFVWEVVNFLVVLAILYFLVFRTLGRILDKRKAKITEGIENAEKAERMLVDADKERQEKLKNAEIAYSEKVAESVKAGKEREGEIIAEANNKAEEILKNSKQKGEDEKKQVIESSKEEIAKMAVLGAEKILAKK